MPGLVASKEVLISHGCWIMSVVLFVYLYFVLLHSNGFWMVYPVMHARRTNDAANYLNEGISTACGRGIFIYGEPSKVD
jgi:hypothetical protein